MKKYLAAVFATILSVSSVADTINYIVPGSNTGGFMMLSKFYAEQLEKSGVKTNVESKGNCVNGMAEFRNASAPTLMIYTLDKDDLALKKGCEFESADQLREIVISDLMIGAAAVCTMDTGLSAKDLQNGKIYTVAVDNARESRMKDVFDKLGIKYKVVNYENSGGTVKGMIGGDTDISFTNSGKSNAVLEAGGKCLFVASNKSIKGVPTLNEVFGTNITYNANTYVLLGKNLSAEQRSQLESAVKTAKGSAEVQAYAAKKWMSVQTDADLNAIIEHAVSELF